nr:hypothetical protein [Tanacetum cinerariifolium]
APIIEDWVSDSEDESETKSPQNVPSFVQPTEQVKSPRPSVQHVETSKPKTTIPKPTSNGTRRNRKACFVCKSLDHLIKDSLTMGALTAVTLGGKVLALWDGLWLMCLLGGELVLVITVLACLGLVTL